MGQFAPTYESLTISESWLAACRYWGIAIRDGSSLANRDPIWKYPNIKSQIKKGDGLLQFEAELPSGMLVEDLRQHGRRLASAVGGTVLRLTELGPTRILVQVIATDPLVEIFEFPLFGRQAADEIIIGRDDTGQIVHSNWLDAGHFLMQGSTRSGKSRWVYSILGQLAYLPWVRIAMLDPSGLLSRPFDGTAHEPWQYRGTKRLDGYASLLQRLCDEMDRRIESMPPRADVFPVNEAHPLIVIACEELPSLYRNCGRDKDLGKEVVDLLARIASEGHKAGFRLIAMCQRAEAKIVGSDFRDQCTWTATLGTQSPATVGFLHPGLTKDEATQHATRPPGVAMFERAGYGITSLRTPQMGDYGTFVDVIRSASGLPIGDRDPAPLAPPAPAA